MSNEKKLTAVMEPFDSFWEGPEDVEKGYAKFGTFYRHNYLGMIPEGKQQNILVISCGPGYFVNLLNQEGYTNVLGIDSDPEKVRHATSKNLNCKVDRAFSFLDAYNGKFDIIICEQELNHMTKTEILDFVKLCFDKITSNGRLIVHSLNGANPITGAEALAQNIDHFNSFTDYSLKQALGHAGFVEINVFPLNLYVFYSNPANYVAMAMAAALSFAFRFCFTLYGKKNRFFTKKIAAVCIRP